MSDFKGTIIEESLADKSILKDFKILSTRVEPVTDEHKTPWIKQWTLDEVEIPASKAQQLAKRIGEALDNEHEWYADFKNDTHHYIIFRNRVFLVDRTDADQYKEAVKYGMSLGIPGYQLDFTPEIFNWKR